MKIINWWTDRYAIGGLFIASIVIGIKTLIMIAHLFFNFSLSNKLGKLSMEHKGGIAVPVKFNAAIGYNGDSTIAVKEKDTGNSIKNTIFYRNEKKQWAIVPGQPAADLNSKNIVYRDTVFPKYQTTNFRPPWKDNWSNVTGVTLETGTVYIKPESFYNRTLLLAPQIIFFALLAYCCWQLAFFLDNIQRGLVFTQSNHLLIRNTGLAILIYQLLLIGIYLLENSYHITIQYGATIPEFRTPVFLDAEPDYHLNWSYFIGAIALLIIAKAFFRGYKLQQDQDLTV